MTGKNIKTRNDYFYIIVNTFIIIYLRKTLESSSKYNNIETKINKKKMIIEFIVKS